MFCFNEFIKEPIQKKVVTMVSESQTKAATKLQGFYKALLKSKVQIMSVDPHSASFVLSQTRLSGTLVSTEKEKKVSINVQSYNEDILQVRISPEVNIDDTRWFDIDKEILVAKPQNIEKEHVDMVHKSVKNGTGLVSISPGGIEYQHGEESSAVVLEKFYHFEQLKRKSRTGFKFNLVFKDSKYMYGIPERCREVILRDTPNDDDVRDPYRLYNLDMPGYKESNAGLYGTIPLLVSINSKGTYTAVFYNNAADTYIDIDTKDRNKHVQIISKDGDVNLFFLSGSNSSEINRKFSSLVGMSFLPPLFSLGYHQCRWSYENQDDVLDVHNKMIENELPCDCLWLDIDYTEKMKYFTFDSKKFPNPHEMEEELRKTGRKIVFISDPHIKVDKEYEIYNDCFKKNLFVMNKKKKDFVGKCWPGKSCWIDFLNPEAREYYAEQFSFENLPETNENFHLWIDMNEPSIFSKPNSMPYECLHHENTPHSLVHNIYGYLHAKASREGMVRRTKYEERSFILSRSFYAGSNRFTSIWTGDNGSSWSHLKMSIPMLLSLNLTGFANVGADVGGFWGNPDMELLIRWYQLGAFYPFYRGHSSKFSKRREPYLFGEETTQSIQLAIQRRYRLIPHLYTLFFKHATSGEGIMNPLFSMFGKNDQRVFKVENQFMLGEELLVCPVLKKGAKSINPYFPTTKVWYDFITGERIMPEEDGTLRQKVGIDDIPVFQMGGTIISLYSTESVKKKNSLMEMEGEPLMLSIALDENREATGEIYFDDGHTFDYTDGLFVHMKISFKNNTLSAVLLKKCQQFKKYIGAIRIMGLKYDLNVKIDGQDVKQDCRVYNNSVFITGLKVPINSEFEISV